MNKKGQHCKYSDSCFTHLFRCCVITKEMCNVNKTEYDIYERDYLKEVKRKGKYKKCQK